MPAVEPTIGAPHQAVDRVVVRLGRPPVQQRHRIAIGNIIGIIVGNELELGIRN